MIENQQRADEHPVHGLRRETRFLEAALHAVAGGRGGVVVITGQTGSGKTRLLQAARTSGRRAGVRWLQATARADERSAPLKPLLDALGGGSRPVLDAARLREHVGVPEARRAVIAHAEQQIASDAVRTPLVIAIDDVHHADDATLLALRTLPGRLAQCPVLWLLVSNQGGAETTVRALTRDAATVLQVDPLDDEAVRALAADVLAGLPDPALLELVDDLGGHPASIVELLRALVEEGLVEVAGGSARISGQGLRRALCDRGIKDARTPLDAAAKLGLTQAELAVAELVARGATNREAADVLILSPHTISSHLRHTFEKLGIRSRIELALLFAGGHIAAREQASFGRSG